MIASPKISQNERKTTEIGAFEVGNFAPFSCPGWSTLSKWLHGHLARPDDALCAGAGAADHPVYGSHGGVVCAFAERASLLAASRNNGAAASVEEAMAAAFELFASHLLGQPAPEALASVAGELSLPCACAAGAETVGVKLMEGWLGDRSDPGLRAAWADMPWASNYDAPGAPLAYGVSKVLRDGGARVLVLDREDLVASYVSMRVAREGRSFHCRGEAGCSSANVTVDVADLVREVRHRVASVADRDAWVASLGLDATRLTYEACVADPEACYATALEFLDVESSQDIVARLLAESPMERSSRTVADGAGKGCPTSKAPLSAVFHSFWLTFGRAIISWSVLEAWLLSLERARPEHSC